MTAEPNQLFCPVCQAEATALPRLADGVGFDCPIHGKFIVSGTIFAVPAKLNAGRAGWQNAWKRAKQHVRPGKLPIITSDDLP